MFSSAGLSKMEAGHKGSKEAADPLITDVTHRANGESDKIGAWTKNN